MRIELNKLLKALMFSTSEPISVKDFQDVYKRYRNGLLSDLEKASEEDKEALQANLEDLPEKIPASDIEDAFDALTSELDDSTDVYRVVQTPNGYSLSTAPEFAPWVRLLRDEAKPMRLSSAAMECLALIAYRQPITRAEMELIRGVSVDSAVSKLLENDLVFVQGHAEVPGRPRLYATTEKFLKYCGLSSLEELPASDVLSAEQISEWLQESQPQPTNEDVGLAPAEEVVSSEDQQ